MQDKVLHEAQCAISILINDLGMLNQFGDRELAYGYMEKQARQLLLALALIAASKEKNK